MSGFSSSAGEAVILAAGNCNGDAACRDDFYSDPVAVGYYKDHVKRIVTRVNTFNGRTYRHSALPSLSFIQFTAWPPNSKQDLDASLDSVLPYAPENQREWYGDGTNPLFQRHA